MSDENPFEVPESCTGASTERETFESPDMFRVDGNLLVCGCYVTLPGICVHTGATENLVSIRHVAQYPSLKPVLVGRNCTVTYFISRSERSRKNRIKAVFVAAIVIGLLLMFSVFYNDSWFLPFGLISGLILLLVGLIGSQRLGLALQLIRFSSPNSCWIRGFPLTFLQKIANLSANRTGSGQSIP